MARLVLASASARRAKILTAIGAAFETVKPEVEEVFYLLDARRTAEENALLKSSWCRKHYPECFSIAADTTIEFEGRCFAKARTPDEAITFLKLFSGKTHTVYTAAAMSRPYCRPELAIEKASVRFKRLSEDIIRLYVAKVNPIDRAGAYDIDELGEMLVEKFTGARSTIMGLPAKLVKKWLLKEKLAVKQNDGTERE